VPSAGNSKRQTDPLHARLGQARRWRAWRAKMASSPSPASSSRALPPRAKVGFTGGVKGLLSFGRGFAISGQVENRTSGKTWSVTWDFSQAAGSRTRSQAQAATCNPFWERRSPPIRPPGVHPHVAGAKAGDTVSNDAGLAMGMNVAARSVSRSLKSLAGKRFPNGEDHGPDPLVGVQFKGPVPEGFRIQGAGPQAPPRSLHLEPVGPATFTPRSP